MNCKEFEKMIPNFLNRQMDYKELKSFSEHMDSCLECREELTIQVLVSEGMVRLEEGSAFDLQKELAKRIQEAEHNMRIHKMLKLMGITLGVIALAAIAVVIWVF